MKVSKWLICAMAVLPAMAYAQFDDGSGMASTPAWKQFKLNPKTTMKLDFRNASVDMIISLYSKASGLTIIKDPSLTGTLTITAPKPVPLDEAFSILNTTLSMKNFRIMKEGNALVIRSSRQDGRGGQGGGGNNNMFGGMTPEQIMQMFSGSRSEIKVYQVKYANAAQVARVVNEVFATSQNAFDQFLQTMGGGMPMNFGGGTGGAPVRLGGGRGGEEPMADESELYAMAGGQFTFGGQRGGGGQFGGGQFGGGRNNGFGGFTGFGRGQQSNVRASSDDYSNSVIVNAPQNDQKQVEALIKQIDKETDQPLKPKVYKLEYAAADQIAAAVQNVLTTNAPRGRGGQGNTNVPIDQRLQQAFRFGSSQAAFGTVVADVRTNSLVVTATDENHTLVAEILKDLDKEVEIQQSTFVIPLSNARADQVSQLLNQAFGGRNGTGNNRNANTGTNRNTQNNNNRNNNNAGGGNRIGGNQAYVPTEEEVAANGLNIDADGDGFLDTDVYVQQGGGFQIFGGGQQQRPGQATGAQTTAGRDSQGRLVNLRDLTNQVTIIPDQNTNSLIIVGSPDNVDLVRKILEQLDRIPEQVMIETLIVEATLDASSKFGVEWKYAQDKPFGTPGTTGNSEGAFGLANASPALQGFRYTLSGGALTGFMNALKTDKKFQVLSTPRIFTSNNSQAEINISQRIPYVLSSREDQNGNLTFTYAFEDVGIILTVTPRITSNGYVTMDITQTANDLQGFTDFNAPIINQREADTTVSVKDGETIILGGIIRNTVTSTVKKIPLLGDIPLIGNLFKSQDKQDVKTELLVFLTPRVVRDDEEARKLRDEEQKKLSKQSQDTLNRAIPPKKQDPPKQGPPSGGSGGGTTGGGGGN